MSESTFEVYLTIAGQVILSKLLAGENLLLTRAVLSSQVIETPEELTAMNPESLETTQIVLTDHGTYTNAELSFELNNLTNDLTLKSIGVYGRTTNTNESLIYVALLNSSEQMTLSAGSPITYVVNLKETFAQGQLQVESSPLYATPISHHSDFTRHIFSQTNDSASLALVNSGTTETFENNDSIVFVPKVDVNNGATLRIASEDYTLVYTNIQGTTINNGVFKAHREYVLYFNNNSFIYKEHEVNVKDGALTYWNGSELKTVQELNINNIFRVQNGILHYYSNGAWHSTQPAGVIYAFARSSALTGYLLCDGSTLNKNNYPELYAVIGHYYGGSGDNFKLPDLRGRTLLGVNSSHALGSTGGAETKTLQKTNLPSHKHSVSGNIIYQRHRKNNELQGGSDYIPINNVQVALTGYSPLVVDYAAHLQSDTTSFSADSDSVGNGTPVDIMNPYIAINYYISTGRSLIS